MSTRSTIDFYTKYSKEKDTHLVARVYKHWDGYPDGMIPLFKKFRKEILKKYGDDNPKARGYGHMINNGEELAAEFIRMFKPDYGDIVPCMKLQQDIEYLYELHAKYGLSDVGKWTLKVFEIDNRDDKELKKLIRTVILD